MAEIRVRDVNPKLIEQLEIIALDLGEATIAGCIAKLIPKYHDMLKRIKEQNEEIGKTVRELRAEQHKNALMQHDFTDVLIDTRNYSKGIQAKVLAMEKLFNSMGQKKRRPASSARPGAKKLSHKKKAPAKKKVISKPKKKK